jgi:hypothetical protein
MSALGIALQPLQVRPDFRSMLISQGPIFLKSFRDDPIERRRELRI